MNQILAAIRQRPWPQRHFGDLLHFLGGLRTRDVACHRSERRQQHAASVDSFAFIATLPLFVATASMRRTAFKRYVMIPPAAAGTEQKATKHHGAPFLIHTCRTDSLQDCRAYEASPFLTGHSSHQNCFILADLGRPHVGRLRPVAIHRSPDASIGSWSLSATNDPFLEKLEIEARTTEDLRYASRVAP